MDCPKTRTSPSSGFSRPLMWRNATLLPVPDGPRIQSTSPRKILRLTPARTSRSPYRFQTRSNSTTVSGCVAGGRIFRGGDRRAHRARNSFVRKKSEMSTQMEASTTVWVVARPTDAAPPLT